MLLRSKFQDPLNSRMTPFFENSIWQEMKVIFLNNYTSAWGTQSLWNDFTAEYTRPEVRANLTLLNKWHHRSILKIINCKICSFQYREFCKEKRKDSFFWTPRILLHKCFWDHRTKKNVTRWHLILRSTLPLHE